MCVRVCERACACVSVCVCVCVCVCVSARALAFGLACDDIAFENTVLYMYAHYSKHIKV